VTHPELRVAERHRHHAALVAALGHAQLHRCAPPLTQEAGDEVGVCTSVWTHTSGGTNLRVVVLEQEAREQRVLALDLGVLEVVRAALLDAATAHGEQLDVGDVALDCERDGVVGAQPTATAWRSPRWRTAVSRLRVRAASSN
jgi:hypothetical protein